MRYTVRYVNAANEVINYLHTDDFLEAINTKNYISKRNTFYNHQSVWIADTINEIFVG